MNTAIRACAAALLTASLMAAAQTRSVAIAMESASPMANPKVFVARYASQHRAGDVVARHADDTGDQALLWSAAQVLDAPTDAAMNTRQVLSIDEQYVGASLHWAQLSPAMRQRLASQGLDDAKLAHLRGERRREAPDGLRTRASRLGDILNSNLWYTGRQTLSNSAALAMLYVGANDGMLHGFNAEDGHEKIAYVPAGLLPRLASLTHTGAAHAHYVDGPVFTGQAPIGIEAAMRTVLVGALGAGGKGFYLLDVTAPAQFANAHPADLVVLDRTVSADPDLGHIFAPPVTDDADPNRSRQIVQLNNRRWAAVMGNGYFSANGQPVLLIQYLDGAHELLKVSPCTTGRACAFAGDNGLSAPRLIDVDGDGRVDIAYAGDLQGHLWKFDLTSRTAGDTGSGWRVAFSGQPFFVARDANGARQPITTAPYWMPHPHGGVMLALGTGRHLERRDSLDTATQSIYGLHDDSSMAASATGVVIRDGSPINTGAESPSRPAALVPQHYTHNATLDGTAYFDASSVPVSYIGSDRQRGWWIDLPLAGQRVLHHPRSFEGQKILVHSVVPTAATASSPPLPWDAGAAYVSVFNLLTGHPPVQPAFMPASSAVHTARIGMASTAPGPALLLRKAGASQLRSPDGPGLTLRSAVTVGARAGWRERP
jgi:type IV pilus assembly protein PilY1